MGSAKVERSLIQQAGDDYGLRATVREKLLLLEPGEYLLRLDEIVNVIEDDVNVRRGDMVKHNLRIACAPHVVDGCLRFELVQGATPASPHQPPKTPDMDSHG
jgi:hypothetical protein